MRLDKVRFALGSYSDLQLIINELTATELMKALELESASIQRKSHIQRLIRRLVFLREREFRNKLNRRYTNGS